MIISFHERRKQKKKEGTKVFVSAVLFQSQSLKAVTSSGSPIYSLLPYSSVPLAVILNLELVCSLVSFP